MRVQQAELSGRLFSARGTGAAFARKMRRNRGMTSSCVPMRMRRTIRPEPIG
jgi:hypothetical protein